MEFFFFHIIPESRFYFLPTVYRIRFYDRGQHITTGVYFSWFSIDLFAVEWDKTTEDE